MKKEESLASYIVTRVVLGAVIAVLAIVVAWIVWAIIT